MTITQSDPKQFVRRLHDVGPHEVTYYSLPETARQFGIDLERLPYSLRPILESVGRNVGQNGVTVEHLRDLGGWADHAGTKAVEIPLVVSRVVMQDFTGVPAVVDFAAMRSAVARLGRDPSIVEPVVRADLVVDHSIQVDKAGSAEALDQNRKIEFQRNGERYEFLKWGQQAFATLGIVPPNAGIVHQVNLEHMARGYSIVDGLHVPDTLVGTDSHTTMINGLGVVGWGVGGIEAEAAMLGQPLQILAPEVIGVELRGELSEGATATDLVLTITEILRREGVVNKFVEFVGEGTRTLSLPDRATIANMAPEYGATIGFFPFDAVSAEYLEATGRDGSLPLVFHEAQQMLWTPDKPMPTYTKTLTIDLASVVPSVAGPTLPQQLMALPELGRTFDQFARQAHRTGDSVTIHPEGGQERQLSDGDIVIAAITSCTNTSNPAVMIAAGLLAREANARGLRVPDGVKTSLAPGSHVVTDYLTKAGLQAELDQLGFQTVGYGCTTCIGNSGPLEKSIEAALADHDIIAAAVLSGNRNFEARIHPTIRSNFLMSPPLVVALALAGTVNINLIEDAIGQDREGKDVYLKDLWPSSQAINATMLDCMQPEAYTRLYEEAMKGPEIWQQLAFATGPVYEWKADSTYIQEPPFFDGFTGDEPEPLQDIQGARPLGLFGDSVTTDHISPAGRIGADSPAGLFLKEQGVPVNEFNSFGARRGNDRVMTRGTFGNVKIKNLMVPGSTGGVTLFYPAAGPPEQMSMFEAAERYKESATPLVVFAGKDYGMGSSRDWAAKGTKLLGVKAVIVESYERIHRSNLVGMGVLPLELPAGATVASLKLDGSETFDLRGVATLEPRGTLALTIHRSDGSQQELTLTVRIDTAPELDYLKWGGILPFVLKQIIERKDN